MNVTSSLKCIFRSMLALTFATLAFATSASAQTQVAAGKQYEGEWYTGSRVVYRITEKLNANEYIGTMWFQHNNLVEPVRIVYLSDGRIQILRTVPSGNVQWFAERPQMFEDPNDGSRKLFVSGHLHGEGVGTAPNEWGTLIIPQRR